jgi:hypothetical protein
MRGAGSVSWIRHVITAPSVVSKYWFVIAEAAAEVPSIALVCLDIYPLELALSLLN